MGLLSTIGKVLVRRKVLDPVSTQDSRLARVLNTFDLTALGVGSTLGVGVYVLAGHVAKTVAGPSVVLSFLIAAIASVFAGLCYAEFGARTPRAGSAYIYSYVCVGEFIAFVIGWNLILEYVIGSASVARGLSLYLDTLVNNTLKNTFIDIAPINLPYMSGYFDFLTFGVSVLLAIFLAFGLKESSMANNIFTLLNLAVVAFVIVAGSLKADPSNWAINPNDVKNVTNGTDIGSGYFFPFGIEGMIKGAATCFYGFVGFDCIATSGEEVKNPQIAIPTAIVTSLFIIFLAYFGTSTVVTLMIPYYAQDVNAPIPYAFEACGWTVAKWIVAIGGIFGLCASLFGAMFPLPRIIYAMASDGIIFRFLGYVSARFQTPVIGTLLAGLLTGLMGALFELNQLVSMMSIGTLLAYTIVAASVLLLRYSADQQVTYLRVNTTSDSDESDTYTENRTFDDQGAEITDERELITPENVTCRDVIKQIFNCNRYQNPNKISEKIVSIEVFIFCVLCIFIGLGAIYLQQVDDQNILVIVSTSVFSILAVIVIISIFTQPVSKKPLSFKVPLVPLIPALSIFINIYLMLMLDMHTWIRFGVWMAVGLPTYCFSVRCATTDTRNMSISSKMFDPPKHTNGLINGGLIYEQREVAKPQNGYLVQNAADVVISLDEHAKDHDLEIPVKENSISESANKVLDQLDEILAFEDSSPVKDVKIDDNLSDNDCTYNSSNVSPVSRHDEVPSVSNLSDSCETFVVADVHRSDATPPLTPKSSPFSPLNKLESEINVNSNKFDDSSDVDCNMEPEDSNNEEELDKKTNNVKVDENIANDEIIQNKIPLPPPLPDLLENLNIPRPKILKLKFDQSHEEKDKSTLVVPEIPPADYSDLESPTEVDDNLKRGSLVYNKFLKKLDKKLQKPAPLSYKNSFTSPERPVVKKSVNKVDKELVDKGPINKENVKKTLENLLMNQINDKNNVNNREIKNTQTNESPDDKNVEIVADDASSKENHFNRSNKQTINKPLISPKPGSKSDILKAIKNKFSNEEKYSNYTKNMNEIFKSIRLRKADSFKEQSNENEDIHKEIRNGDK